MENISEFAIISRLLKLVRPLKSVMTTGVILGVLSRLCGIFLAVIGAKAVAITAENFLNPSVRPSIKMFAIILVGLGVGRGVFRLGEQYCNNYVAINVLSLTREKVFTALRKLCPAKLETREKGNLIAIITSDVETLEAFFAGTVAPVAVSAIVAIVMSLYIGYLFPVAGVVAAIGFVTVGGMVPISSEINSYPASLEYRNAFGKMDSFILSTIYGIDETIQYQSGHKTVKEIVKRSDNLADTKSELVEFEKNQRMLITVTTNIFAAIILVVMYIAYAKDKVSFNQLVVAVVATVSAFRPVAALAAVSSNLNQAIASGKRILDLLDEEPKVDEVIEGTDIDLNNSPKNVLVVAKDVKFGYDETPVLTGTTLAVKKGHILGIHGASGSGKSTMLKLLMRFWDVNDGGIYYSNQAGKAVLVKRINTKSLRANQSFVTQDTWISHDTIAKNIAIAKADATMEEIAAAAKKASLHDFIETLPQGYNTVIGEDGYSISSGEKQRIGLARAFLHDANLVLLDEPTSVLDALNEGIILKSIKEEAEEKTVVLVSHRRSTLNIADSIWSIGTESAGH
ncbi:MAG: ABC transporter ATP-binding protein/permease [Pseudobutyrivibrio sp.]|nr:ABC transporter ATP-binding protein/permease [Pseudobutyrivibrio sp.]